MLQAVCQSPVTHKCQRSKRLAYAVIDRALQRYCAAVGSAAKRIGSWFLCDVGVWDSLLVLLSILFVFPAYLYLWLTSWDFAHSTLCNPS